MQLNAVNLGRMAIATVVAVIAISAYVYTRGPAPHTNPSSHRWLTLRIDNSELPLRIRSASVNVTYAIDNLDCLDTLPISGAIPMPTHESVVATRRISDSIFEAKIALDPFRDEDYDGLGKCHWGLSIVSARMTDGQRHVEASVAGPIVERFETTERFFPARTFDPSDDRDPIVGRGMLAAQKRSPNEKIYRITISAKEATRD